jgi:hypothetical protein
VVRRTAAVSFCGVFLTNQDRRGAADHFEGEGGLMEHIPAIHAAKVGMRYPARVLYSGEYGMSFELDLSALAPGRSPTLNADLLWEKSLAPYIAQELTIDQRTEVVLVEVSVYFGHLYVSLPADPQWLEWDNGTVRQLAQRIHETGETVLLPVLADALEEAGCTERALLVRCRQPDGDDLNWLVDLLATQE